MSGEAAGEGDTGSVFTAEEDAFFSSGGESALAPETGGAGDHGGDGEGGDAGKAPIADKDGDKGGDKTPKTVPLTALQEERTARKEAKAERDKLALENAELRGKFSILEKLGRPADPVVEAPKGPPKAEDDIFGAVNHLGETLAAIQKREDDAKAATEAATVAADENTKFVNSYKADAEKFEATSPDYRKAYDFLLNSRAAELKAIGYDTPKALHEALNADEMAIAQMAFSKGKSPAEMIYALANQRGYKKADGDAKPGKGAEKLDAIARGQELNKSLDDTGGNAGENDMTLARLLDLPMPEYEAYVSKNEAKVRRLMGG